MENSGNKDRRITDHDVRFEMIKRKAIEAHIDSLIKRAEAKANGKCRVED